MAQLEALLLTYQTNREEFDSMYERNKFYRGLFGYKQTVKKNGKEYKYDKEGLMDKVECIRIDDSVFILPKMVRGEVEEYFSGWGERVNYHIFSVILEDSELIERFEGEIDG